jgi:ABC-2 type transport system permease protein
MRYFKIYASLVRFSIQQSLQFRLDFFIKIFMDCVYYAAQFFFFSILLNHTSSLAGWRAHEVQLLAASVCIMDALQMTFVSTNLWTFPKIVNDGGFDSYLLRPISARFFVSARRFQLDSFVNLVIAVCILFYVLLNSPIAIPLHRLALYSIGISLGAFVFYCMYFTCLCGVFWFHSAKGFGGLHWTLSKIGEYPDSIYPNAFRKVLIFALPYALLSSYPTRLLFDDNLIEVFGTILVGASSAFAISQLIWRWGLKNYSSASS